MNLEILDQVFQVKLEIFLVHGHISDYAKYDSAL